LKGVDSATLQCILNPLQDVDFLVHSVRNLVPVSFTDFRYWMIRDKEE
jgi:hypothetical protein